MTKTEERLIYEVARLNVKISTQSEQIADLMMQLDRLENRVVALENDD